MADSSVSPTSVQYCVTENKNELTASTLISPANFSGNGILTAEGSTDYAIVYPNTELNCTEVIPLGGGVAAVGGADPPEGPTTGGVTAPTLTGLLWEDVLLPPSDN